MSEFKQNISDVVRIDKLLENVSGYEDIACAIIDEFLVQAPVQLGELDSAISQGDCRVIFEAAHKLKGALVAIHALPASALVSAIESAGKSQALEAARSEHTALHARVDELIWHLKRWRKQVDERQRSDSEGHG